MGVCGEGAVSPARLQRDARDATSSFFRAPKNRNTQKCRLLHCDARRVSSNVPDYGGLIAFEDVESLLVLHSTRAAGDARAPCARPPSRACPRRRVPRRLAPAHLRAIARRTTAQRQARRSRERRSRARRRSDSRRLSRPRLLQGRRRRRFLRGRRVVERASVGRGNESRTRFERGALSVDGDDEKDHDDEQSRDARLAPFDVDDATSAWVLCRFAFIWVVFGYVAVPAYALLVDTPVMDLPPARKPRRCWPRRREARRDKRYAGRRTRADGTPRRRCFRSAENVPVPFAALWNTHDVALGGGVRRARLRRRESRGRITRVSAGDETVAAGVVGVTPLRVDSRRRHRARRRRHRVRARRARGGGAVLPGIPTPGCLRARRTGSEKRGTNPRRWPSSPRRSRRHFSPSDFPRSSSPAPSSAPRRSARGRGGGSSRRSSRTPPSTRSCWRSTYHDVSRNNSRSRCGRVCSTRT